MKLYMVFDGTYSATSERPTSGPVVVEGRTMKKEDSPIEEVQGYSCTFRYADAVREWVVEEGPVTLEGKSYELGEVWEQILPACWAIETVPHDPKASGHEFCGYCGCDITAAGGRVGWDCPACMSN